MGRAVAATILILLFPAPSARVAAATPAPDWAALEAGEAGTVASVVDGDTVILESGLSVRLVGIQAPKLPLGREGFEAWPLAGESRAALAALTLNKPVRLYYGGARRDRYNRALAHLRAGALPGAAVWVQGALLEAGMARVYTFRDNRALIAELLAAERLARAAGRGLWADAFYALRTPATASQFVNSFQVVEGRVLDVAVVRGRAYLNFGPDWKTDFTVSVTPRDLRAFKAQGVDVEVYQGQSVRVRGWLRNWNGPMIEVTHPEQIETVTPAAP